MRSYWSRLARAVNFFIAVVFDGNRAQGLKSTYGTPVPVSSYRKATTLLVLSVGKSRPMADLFVGWSDNKWWKLFAF